MRAGLTLLAGLLALVGQQFIATVFALEAWTPDLLSVLFLWLGVSRPLGAATVSQVALLGLLADGFAGSPLGLHLLHGLALYGLAFGLGNRVRFQGLVGSGLLGGLGGIASVALVAGLARLFFHDTLLADRITALLVPRVVVVALGVVVCFPILSRLDDLSGRRPDGDTLG